jgi:hypothetical protein
MTAATSLIPGLDDMVRNGNPERLAEVARRIAALFLACWSISCRTPT